VSWEERRDSSGQQAENENGSQTDAKHGVLTRN
jgi:hypothetical protein